MADADEALLRYFRAYPPSALQASSKDTEVRRTASTIAYRHAASSPPTARAPFKRHPQQPAAADAPLLRTKSAPLEVVQELVPTVVRTRVLLTSNGLSTPSLKFAFWAALAESTGGKSRHEAVMAYVPTAKLAPTNDDEDDDSCDPAEEVQRRAAVLSEQLGLGSVRLVDLAVTQAVDLQLALAGVDCVYVEGGNTFWLLHHLEQSGFRDLIRQLVTEQGVLYVGKSAGAIVTGQTIATALWKGWDDPTVVPDLDTTNPEELEGMGLLPCCVFPHFAARWQGLVQRRRGDLQDDLVCLSDGTGELWVDGVCERVIDEPWLDDLL